METLIWFSNICVRKKRRMTIALLIMLLFSGSAAASEHWTVNGIANGMQAAEQKFTDVRLNYTTLTTKWEDPNGPANIVEALYAEKCIQEPNGQKRPQYHDVRACALDPQTGKCDVFWDKLSIFDGVATTALRRKLEPDEPFDEPMVATIVVGYDSNEFGGYYVDPHTKIWYLGGISFAGLLKENSETFNIENPSEFLKGIPCVKLVGSFASGKGTLRLWVSPEKGFLPLKCQVIDSAGRWRYESELDDLIQLPSGMWYPKTIRSPAEAPGGPNPAWREIYHISEISLQPIQQQFFTPDFPPNTRVFDEVLGICYVTY